MKKTILLGILFILATACKTANKIGGVYKNTDRQDFTIAFGSCNKTDKENLLWDDILIANPDVWIWGGDNIYADTDDMEVLRKMYNDQKNVPGYTKLLQSVSVVGTWDDHDYGLNDGGVEFSAKKESQQEFLDFIDVPKNSPRRTQEGVYISHEFKSKKGVVKIIVLDTRYFRTALTPDTETEKRTKPNPYGQGTVLGKTQWQWLENELSGSEADFNIIVSSIQVLSNEHGFECWGNFPHEVDRLEKTIVDSKAKSVIILSGDRHISEFSRKDISGLDYPLIDFTSSGLTHAYRDFSGEPNPFRVGQVVFTESFGVLRFDFDKQKVAFAMVGDNGEILQHFQQSY